MSLTSAPGVVAVVGGVLFALVVVVCLRWAVWALIAARRRRRRWAEARGWSLLDSRRRR